MKTHLNAQISVQQNLEFEVLLALVLHLQGGFETLLGQGDTVHQTKLVRPRLLELFAQHRVRQTEVQLDRIIAFLAVFSEGLGRGLAQKLPVRVPCEAVLREGGRSVIRGGRTEDLQ